MLNKHRRRITLLLSGATVLLFASIGMVRLLRVKSQADVTTQEVSSENYQPTITITQAVDENDDDILITGLTPKEGTTENITIRGVVTDQNGCSDVSNVRVVMLRLGVLKQGSLPPCTLDGNSCYQMIVPLTDCNGTDDLDAKFEATIPVQNYVDPTDIGSPYENENWFAVAFVKDNTEPVNQYDMKSFEVNSMAAFSIAPSAINYGIVALGDTTEPQTVVFTNTGNRAVNSTVLATSAHGGDMVSNQTGFSDIPASDTHYSLVSAFPYDMGSAVSGSASTDLALALSQQTDDATIPIVPTYWRMKMPSHGVNGTYANTLIFTATSSSSAAVSPVYSWVETRPMGDVSTVWSALGATKSADKLYAIGASTDGYLSKLFQMTNGTWSELKPFGDTNMKWTAVALDQSGKNIVVTSAYAASAGSYGTLYGKVFESFDDGSSWYDITPVSGKVWTSVCGDRGFNHVIASTQQRLYMWAPDLSVSEIRPKGDQDGNWASTAVALSGYYMLAADAGTASDGHLYLSSDNGSTWNMVGPKDAGNDYIGASWSSVAVGEDGLYMVAASADGKFYTSSDHGTTWVKRDPTGGGSPHWTSVSIDWTSASIIATTLESANGAADGKVYFSYNGGATWAEEATGATDPQKWQVGLINYTSNLMMAGQKDGRLYIGTKQ